MISRYLFWVDDLLIILFFALAAISGLWASFHALLNKRDPRSALVWVTVSLSIPILGPFSYWILGINRITRRAMRWQQRGRRLSGTELKHTQSATSVFFSPPLEYLQELAQLGDRVVRNRLRSGTLITPLENGESAYPAMIQAIDNATDTVNLATYIFDGDGAGAPIVSALASAAARGVSVRVIIDAMGEKYSTVRAKKVLEGTGVDVRLYLPLSSGPFINLRNHRKLLLVDGRVAFTGGMNIRTSHCIELAPPEKAAMDLHFRVSGPVVADLQKIFLEDWHFVSGELLDIPSFFPPLEECGTAVARAIGDGPDREFRKLEWIIMGAISVARHKIKIMTPYFIPDRPMISALSTAALRGVDVTLVLPSHNNLPFVAWASRASYWELIRNGVKIAEQSAPFAHTKIMLVDDVFSLIGSANIDTRSLHLNFELNLSVFDADFSSALNRYFEKSLSRSRLITLHELDEYPTYIKLRNNAARLFSPYL